MEKVQFQDPLRFLNIVGLDPRNNDKLSKIRRFLAMLNVTITLVLAFLELFLHFQGLETCSRASESMVPEYQMIVKIIVLVYHKDEIAELIRDCQNFWDLQFFGDTFKSDFAKPHLYMKRFFFIYRALLALNALMFVFLTIITKNSKPMAISYGESEGLEPPYNQIYFVIHTVGIVIIFNVMTGFDGLFFFLVVHVLVELQMVKIAIRTGQINRNKLITALEHHSFALSFITKLNNVFSILLLNQHLTCLFGICFELFILSKDGLPPDFDLVSKCLPLIIAYATQTYTFCFAGTLLINWSSTIANEVFYDDWNQDSAYNNKTEKLMAIRIGQQSPKLTLGGFADLDLESFNLVMNQAFTFFTFVNSMI